MLDSILYLFQVIQVVTYGVSFFKGIWVVSYVLNEIHEDIAWLQVVSRFMLLFAVRLINLIYFMKSTCPIFHLPETRINATSWIGIAFSY